VDLDRRLDVLRTWQRLLDSAFELPGTRIRLGWDPILGLVPWLGDVLTALMATVMIVHAHQMRLPRVVQLRMLFNVAIDMLLGIVPLAGDVADVFWRANARNLALIERHVARPGPASAGDWLFVIGVLALILAIAAIPLLALSAVITLLSRVST
jgi:hypothetical protein